MQNKLPSKINIEKVGTVFERSGIIEMSGEERRYIQLAQKVNEIISFLDEQFKEKCKCPLNCLDSYSNIVCDCKCHNPAPQSTGVVELSISPDHKEHKTKLIYCKEHNFYWCNQCFKTCPNSHPQSEKESLLKYCSKCKQELVENVK